MVLADTNVVLRLILEAEKLSGRAESAMATAAEEGGWLAIAAVTLWEIALLESKSKVKLHSSIDSFLEKVEQMFHVLPLTRQIAVCAAGFSS